MTERFGVTIAFLAAIVVLIVTGHMTQAYWTGFSVALGLIGTAWFQGHQAAMQQLQQPPAPVSTQQTPGSLADKGGAQS